MPPARRAAIRATNVSPDTHAGLWLDRFLEQQTDGVTDTEEVKAAKASLIQQVSERTVPNGYRDAYLRWATGWRDAWAVPFEVQGRMISGLGAKGALEVGIHLHRTWGVPYIPGSALKGLAASVAHKLLEDPAWRKGEQEDGSGYGESHLAMFGSIVQQGAVVFHDAWWIPPKQQDTKLPIHADVMTVHHADYYMKGDVPASDTDSPNPVPFLSVNGRYLVVVESLVEGGEAWVTTALNLLAIGLEKLGIGSKTNAGYGRLVTTEDPRRLPVWRVTEAAAAEGLPSAVAAAAPVELSPREELDQAKIHGTHLQLVTSWAKERGPKEAARKEAARALGIKVKPEQKGKYPEAFNWLMK